MKVFIIKQNLAGEETWRYQGEIIERASDHLVLEAFFDREDMEFHGMPLYKGDRFVETYYFGRWYNIFEIHDRDDDHLKGWYCNISTPAVETSGQVVYKDLALDLLVFPDGRQIVLDEDEFEALNLPPREQKMALTALAELQRYFSDEITAAN